MSRLRNSFLATFLTSQFTTLPYPTSDFSDATIIVTGGNSGLGLEAARHFTRLNAGKVILAVRGTAKGMSAKLEIEKSTQRSGVVEVWQLDLSSYDSVKAFSERAKKLNRLDVLVENAGVATFAWEMVERDEKTITTNVVSTFLLALLLLPKLNASALEFGKVGRLVIVSSEAHELASFREKEKQDVFAALNDKSSSMMGDRYNTSKLIEILIVRQLALQLSAVGESLVVLNTLTPGFSHSQLMRNATWYFKIPVWIAKTLLARTSEMGSRALVYNAAAETARDTHGKYLADCKIRRPSAFVESLEGEEVQKRVYVQLMAKLDTIVPGIMDNIHLGRELSKVEASPSSDL